MSDQGPARRRAGSPPPSPTSVARPESNNQSPRTVMPALRIRPLATFLLSATPVTVQRCSAHAGWNNPVAETPVCSIWGSGKSAAIRTSYRYVYCAHRRPNRSRHAHCGGAHREHVLDEEHREQVLLRSRQPRRPAPQRDRSRAVAIGSIYRSRSRPPRRLGSHSIPRSRAALPRVLTARRAHGQPYGSTVRAHGRAAGRRW